MPSHHPPTHQPPPHCSIVIRAYNEARHIGHLLAEITRQTFQDFEIILVDSGSTDATLDIAAQYPVRLVHITPQQFTFGRSLNLGIAASSAELIVMASAHVYPIDQDWLANLLAPFDDSRVALTYGQQRGDSATKFSEHQFFHQYFPDVSQPDQADPFCNNANAAIRRSLWLQNPYDEQLSGLEDLAWASWAKQQGYKIAYVAEAGIIHIHEESSRQVFNRYRREAMAMQQILPKSRFSFRNFVRLFLTHALQDVIQSFRQRVFLANFASIIGFRLMQFWGTYWGYNRTPEFTAELKQTFYYSPSILTTNRQSVPSPSSHDQKS
ncbi:MAG: glycosyltransferase family 2 protein [Anaerolineae bacterium]|nr:glycosyltransferase family 2 protein [Anaerolineae bacterium]